MNSEDTRSWLTDPDLDAEPPYRMRVPRSVWLIPIIIALSIIVVVAVLARDEMRTSKLQAEWLSNYASQSTFHMEPGANSALSFPSKGPYNQRLGYSYIPFYLKALQGDGYDVAAQMRVSPTFRFFQKRGIYPIYNAKTVAGLSLSDRDGNPLYKANYPNHVFTDFPSIPPLLVDTLLYIENRELLKDGPNTRNPAIEWDRFFYAAFGQIIHKFLPGFNAGGGSTLATQIEKFRFSPGGQTNSGIEKMRQIVAASLRIYLGGQDTREARKKIVLDYMNSTPLSARPGFGEVNSIGDGLWAWFGIDLNDAVTALNLPESDKDSLRAKAHMYRASLGLILAQRRPSYYLLSDHAALDDLTDASLDRLLAAHVISKELHAATKSAAFKFLPEAPPPPQAPYIEQKAVNALRNHLLSMLGLKKLYEVDRLDLSATTTLDQAAQQKTVKFLQQMGDPVFLKSIGLYGFRLLDPNNDPKKIKWSVVLFERTPDGNKMRIQADNVDQPFDMNEGLKLDLGSTAKLRTLVTYLEIMAEIYKNYHSMSKDDLMDMADDAPDNLSQWAMIWLANHPNDDLDAMMDAALNRKYSGSTSEVFFTGSGAHTFKNFEREEDFEVVDLHEAFRKSVNLVFIRLMRDIVNYTTAQGEYTKEDLLEDPDEPARQQYLERFADKEGSVFLNRYIGELIDLSPDAMLEKLLSRAHKGATARTILFRSVRPKATYEQYVQFMRSHPLPTELSETRLRQLYRDYPPERYNLSDRGFITGINPMQLWLGSYLQANPKATRRAIMEVSKPVRIESYGWLFHPRLKHAQDTRIRIILEEEAFAHIQKRWARLGYPFNHLVPSYATAIGSSADRPGALAELVGIILNDGKKLPTLRFEKLEFGHDTPFQTELIHTTRAATPLLDPAITRAMKRVMTEVVDNGTAKRVNGVYKNAKGEPLLVGGKTGTGDQRYDEFAAGGRLISSRVVNRTGTFAFFLGDHFFGTVTAYVAGEDAADYKFTSALSAQMLKSLAPILQPLITSADQASIPVPPDPKLPE